MNNFKTLHKNILDILNNENLRHEYFVLFHDFMITDTFDEEYIIKLVDSNFLENIKNSAPAENCLKIYNTINHNICRNCRNTSYNSNICNTCGEEFIGSNNNYIEQSYKKFYSYSYHKIKNHTPKNYCNIWLERLQGKETVNITSENFNKILNLAKENSAQLSCEIIRKWLKSLSLTKYNPHVTWIRIQIESICNIKGCSYELTFDETVKILEYFNKMVAELYEIIRESRKNVLYYPYCIVKILSFVIQDKERLSILLSNVHFQSSKTLAQNEYIWKKVCSKLGYKYIPFIT